MLLMELWEHVTLPQNVPPREEPSEDHVHQDLVSAVSVSNQNFCKHHVTSCHVMKFLFFVKFFF